MHLAEISVLQRPACEWRAHRLDNYNIVHIQLSLGPLSNIIRMGKSARLIEFTPAGTRRPGCAPGPEARAGPQALAPCRSPGPRYAGVDRRPQERVRRRVAPTARQRKDPRHACRACRGPVPRSHGLAMWAAAVAAPQTRRCTAARSAWTRCTRCARSPREPQRAWL